MFFCRKYQVTLFTDVDLTHPELLSSSYHGWNAQVKDSHGCKGKSLEHFKRKLSLVKKMLFKPWWDRGQRWMDEAQQTHCILNKNNNRGAGFMNGSSSSVLPSQTLTPPSSSSGRRGERTSSWQMTGAPECPRCISWVLPWLSTSVSIVENNNVLFTNTLYPFHVT